MTLSPLVFMMASIGHKDVHGTWPWEEAAREARAARREKKLLEALGERLATERKARDVRKQLDELRREREAQS